MNRPSWTEYFKKMTELVSTRSTCLRRKVGAIIIKDNQVIATGYNGPPRGISRCVGLEQCPVCHGQGFFKQQLNNGEHTIYRCTACNNINIQSSDSICIRNKLNIPSGERHELCRGLHAEQNCIIQAARHGISIKNSTMYCTNKPCIVCVKMIINAGITKVWYIEDYPDVQADKIIEQNALCEFSLI